MKDDKLIPKRRFKEFENAEAWEQRRLGSITESFSGGTPAAGKSDYYGGKIPFIRSGEISSDKTELFVTEAGLNSSSAKMVNEGDILYALYGATSGEVGISKINGAINQAILAIRSIENDDHYLIAQWLRTQKEKIISTYLQGGQGNLSGSIVKELMIILPANKDEQKTISSFLGNLDNLITLHQRKLKKLKETKSAYLTEMFPKDGEKYPKRRFAGFNGPWEQRKLGELSDSVEYGLNAAATEFDGKNKYIRITDIDDESRRFLETDLTSPNVDLSNADNYKLESGDILFARTGASVGKSYIYKEYDGLVYYAGFLIRARIKPEYDAEFVFQCTLTNEYNKYIRITSQRSGQPGINAQEYAEFNLRVSEYDEQAQIGSFFRNLDNLITLHQRKLEKLENLKKAYLNEMFV